MREWEYEETSSDASVTYLNSMGAKGWELAAVEGKRLIFKRPVTDDDAAISPCPSCRCMTHTVGGKCGKCGGIKSTDDKSL